MANPALVVVKRFTYRGNAEEWSNKYFYRGTVPTTPAGWKALVDALAAKEAACFTPDCKVVRAYCYADGSLDSVYTVDYTALGAEVPGTGSTASGEAAPGDAAVWVRWTTDKRNTKGKTVFLRKYFHGAWMTPGTGNDGVASWQHTALLALGNACSGGSGAIPNFLVSSHDDHLGTTPAVAQWITTRTLKRRGKRPPT